MIDYIKACDAYVYETHKVPEITGRTCIHTHRASLLITRLYSQLCVSVRLCV